MDKQVAKLIAADCGIATAPAVLLTAGTAAGYRWTHPVVVKPVAAGSSRGVTLVGEPAQLPQPSRPPSRWMTGYWPKTSSPAGRLTWPSWAAPTAPA